MADKSGSPAAVWRQTVLRPRTFVSLLNKYGKICYYRNENTTDLVKIKLWCIYSDKFKDNNI